MSSGDRAALVALCRSTGGTRWNTNDNWDTNANLKQWHGVQVNDDGRVVELDLNNTNLKGTIPEALGALTELKVLDLHGNKLKGKRGLDVFHAYTTGISSQIATALAAQQPAGPIPEALRALEELAILGLNGNKFTGPIPEALGTLKELTHLWLDDNKLTGVIPTGLGNLSALSAFEFGNTGLKAFLRRGNRLTGGPAYGEGLDSWREGLARKQKTKLETFRGDQMEEEAPVPLGSPNGRHEAVRKRVRSPKRASLSPGKEEEVDRVFKAQLSSSAGLDSLIRKNPGALEDIQRVIEAPVAGSSSEDNELSDMQSRRKLSTLVTMSTALGEVVLKHTEDMDVKRKELDLPPFSRAYYTAVRTGICNAYLAASVIDSDWVSTSKTGGMGKAGAALKVMSSAIPVVGGPTRLAGKAMKTGDHYLQTRRLVKLTAMGHDAIECCSLARRLALQLADGLRNDAGAGANEVDHIDADITAGMNGGSGSGQGPDVLPAIMSEDDVFEYVLKEVASCEHNDHGGKRLGKKHLRQLLQAVQRGCLDGLSCTEQKARTRMCSGQQIAVLLLEILPEADIRPAATSSTPKEVIVQPLAVVEAPHDSGLPSMTDFAALQASVEALKSDIKPLRDKVAAIEKRVPDGDCEPGDRVNAGGGQVLQQKREMREELNTFWQRKENAGA
ncbi:unnamed protein product, partial [Ectocarpus sp. 13 AM-2016]